MTSRAVLILIDVAFITCWQVLTSIINNTPDILNKMNKLCSVDAPCQSYADLGGTWPKRAVLDRVGNVLCI